MIRIKKSKVFVKIVDAFYIIIERLLFTRQSAVIKKNTLLLVRLDAIGDYVLFRNFIEVLKDSERYKNYQITLCGNIIWKDLAERFDGANIDEFIWVDLVRIHSFKYRMKIFSKIHSKGFECLIHPTFSRTSFGDKLVSYSGAKSRIGNGGEPLILGKQKKSKTDLSYDQLIVSGSKYRFEFYRNLDFFEELLSIQITCLKPSLPCNNLSDGEYIIICPGATESYKRWSTTSFAMLCNMLKVDFPDKTFAICGSENDKNLATNVINKSSVKFSDYTGKLNLPEFVNLIGRSHLVITNDSGPFHISVALNRNVACIANGSDYGRFTPYPPEMKTRSVTTFPDEVMKYTEQQRIEKFHKRIPSIDINVVSPESVYERIKSNLFNVNFT